MTSTRAAFSAILGKDLRVEFRTMRSLPAMVLFAVTTFIIFRFGLDRTSLSGSLAGGVLWTTLLFAAVLGINRIFVSEREEGGFDAVRLAPVDRTALFTAKATALFIYLAVLELIVVPTFAVFFLADWSGLLPLIPVLAGANIGFAALGTLISSMAVNSRARARLPRVRLVAALMAEVGRTIIDAAAVAAARAGRRTLLIEDLCKFISWIKDGAN